MTLLNIKDIKATFSQNVLYHMKDDLFVENRNSQKITLAGFSQRGSQMMCSCDQQRKLVAKVQPVGIMSLEPCNNKTPQSLRSHSCLHLHLETDDSSLWAGLR